MSEKQKIGNGAKMREALVQVSSSLCPACRRRNCKGCPRSVAPFMSAVRKALAEPPRNCDVGTPEEQYARWRRFCDSQKCCNNQCPVYRLADVCGSKASCNLIWAQMPYEEGGER